MIVEAHVTRPTLMPGRGDHRHHGMTISVETLLADDQGWTALGRARSVKGNGTTTTSHGSQITEGFLVFRTRPFIERLRERCVVGGIERADALQGHHVSLDILSDEITGRRAKRLTDLFRNRYLPFARNPAGQSHLLLYSLRQRQSACRRKSSDLSSETFPDIG